VVKKWCDKTVTTSMSQLLQVDTTGNIVLVDHDDVTQSAEKRVGEELMRRDPNQ